MDHSLTQASGALLGELAARTGNYTAQNIFKDVEQSTTKTRVRQAKAYAILQMVTTEPALVWQECYEPCRAAMFAGFSADPVTACATVRAAATVLVNQKDQPDRELLAAVARSINHQSIDVRRTTAVALYNYAASVPDALPNDILKVTTYSVSPFII